MTGQKTPRKAPQKRIKAFDFFCGAGGLTRGLLDSKIDVLAGIDNDPKLSRTYQNNNSPSQFECSDINDVDISKLRQKYGITEKDVVLYAACTPCQPFSSLNQRRKGSDPRDQLLLSFAEIVRASPPDFILVENVPGLGNAYGSEIFQSFLSTLKIAGFATSDSHKLDAQEFGVPQVRKRFLLIASRHGQIKLPRPSRKRTTVRDAISDFPKPSVGPTLRSIRSKDTAFGPEGLSSDENWPNHVFRPVSDDHLKILNAVPKDGGSRADVVDTSILLDCHQNAPNLHKDVFGRIAWDGPAPTLTCRCTDIYCGRFTHPDENRGLSLREAAAIQTFPNDYKFYGTFSHASKQIGNAVPVALARRLGLSVVNSAKNSNLL